MIQWRAGCCPRQSLYRNFKGPVKACGLVARRFLPASGRDVVVRLAEHLRQHKDGRIKYVISNGRIYSAPGFGWRRYTGANPHKSHVHISVKGDKRHYDSATKWKLP